ncbi:MAG: FAD:protein FMN transferase [Anaerotignum faecicola]
MNWKKIIAIGLTGCFLFSGCAEQRQNAQKMGEEGTQEDSYESTTFAMDTVMTFHIVAPDGEDLLIDAEQEVKRLEKLFSVTDEDSDIEQINDNAGDKAVTVSADTLALLKAGKQLGKATNNAFDMAIYPIVKAWGFTENEYTIPTQETLDELLPLTKVSNVTIDEDASTVYLEKEGMAVDLGGIAKGYASDKLAELLKKKGCEIRMAFSGRQCLCHWYKAGRQSLENCRAESC